MEGGRELKPLMGNEAERGGERKALSLDRETGLRRFFFFFFHDRETQSCL